MALKDIFKKKKREQIEKSKEVDKPSEIKAEEVSRNIYPKKETISQAYQVLKRPHISEKATNLLESNQYVFEVFPRANKNEIKKAIENVYKVNVLSVKIINNPAKRRRLGRISGWRKGYKKAIVKIKEGQKIEVLPR